MTKFNDKRDEKASVPARTSDPKPRRRRTARGSRDVAGKRGGGRIAPRRSAFSAIFSGEPCVLVADRRILCGEPHPTPEDASAMIFASFDLIYGEPHRGEPCLMPLEALAEAIETGRIVVPAGDDE